MSIFSSFKRNKNPISETEFVKEYEFINDGKLFHVIITKARANKYSFIHCSLYLAPYSKENIFKKVTCFFYYLLLHACVYTHTHTKTLWLGQDIYGFSSYT